MFLADHLRGVRGRDELETREGLGQVIDDRALPLRVEVQVDLVDEDDANAFGGRVVEVGD